MKKPKATKPRLHGGRGSKKALTLTYAQYKLQFRQVMSKKSLRLEDRQNLRFGAIYRAPIDLRHASSQYISTIVRNPVKDMVRVCGALLSGKLAVIQIARIYHRLYSHGDCQVYGSADFDWRISPHEYPIHLFVDALAESLLDYDLDNPAWGFVLSLVDQVAFQTILETAEKFGLDFSTVRRMTRRIAPPLEEWKEEAILGLLDLQETRESEAAGQQANTWDVGSRTPVPIDLLPSILISSPWGPIKDICDIWPIGDAHPHK